MNPWWTQLTQEEVEKIATEHGIYDTELLSQSGTDRTLQGKDDVDNVWTGIWYDGESLYDIRWTEA